MMARVLVGWEIEEIVELCKKTMRMEERYQLDRLRHAETGIKDAAERARRIMEIIEGRS